MDYDYTPLYYSEPTPVRFVVYDYEFGVAFHDFVWSNWKRIPIEEIIVHAKSLGYTPDEAIIELNV